MLDSAVTALEGTFLACFSIKGATDLCRAGFNRPSALRKESGPTHPDEMHTSIRDVAAERVSVFEELKQSTISLASFSPNFSPRAAVTSSRLCKSPAIASMVCNISGRPRAFICKTKESDVAFIMYKLTYLDCGVVDFQAADKYFSR
jgi:hypothetical protein